MLMGLQSRYPQLAFGSAAPSQPSRSSPSQEFASHSRKAERPLSEIGPPNPSIEVATPSPTPPSNSRSSTPASGTKPKRFEAADLEPVKRELAAIEGPWRESWWIERPRKQPPGSSCMSFLRLRSPPEMNEGGSWPRGRAERFANVDLLAGLKN